MRLVDANGGLTLLPELVALDLDPARRAHTRRFVDPAPSREVSLLHRRPAARRRLREAVADVIRDILSTDLATPGGGNVLPPR